MATDTKPLAKFSWSLKSNTGLSSSGSQDNITPEMYGAIMGVLADPGFPQVEIARLQAQVDALAGALEELCGTACESVELGDWPELQASLANSRAALAAVGR